MVIIDARLAARLWDSPRAAVGQRLIALGEDSEVIGVVAAIPCGSILDERPTFYLPQMRMARWNVTTVVRADRGLALDGSIRHLIDEIDPTLSASAVRPLESYVGSAIAGQRLAAEVMSGFAVAAFALACLGLYGVLSYSVALRRREMAIRLACGARPTAILGLVLREGLRMVLAGIAVGILGALVAGHLLGGLLVDVAPADGPTFTGVSIVFAAIAALACLAPAYRSVSTDPATILRTD